MTSVKVLQLLLLALSMVSVGADCPFPFFNGKIVLSSESLLKNSFPDSSEALVECAKGYEREEGPTSIICLNGVWSEVKLKCKKIDCGEPKPSLHMSYDTSEGTLFGAYIKTICETGYDLEGSSFRQCLVSGWSGKAECILTTCEVPDPIENGVMIVPRVIPEFNDVITFSCDDNYVLVGNSTITCGEYGDYSSPPPTCIAITTPTEESTTTDKATTTDMTTASTRSHVITTPTEESTTTDKATTTDMISASTRSHVITTPTEESTTTDMTTASTRSHVITPTEASTATTTDMTTDMTTASTRSHEGLIEVHTTDFKNDLVGFVAPLTMKASLATTLILTVLLIIALIGFLIYRQLKYKGSYNTGEDLPTKEELLHYQRV
ncbi:complement decay-accelerating factor-like isoform X2 [Carassius auratus]|uniref:Complement decay-accelerating factor-like isoform X2 n=1 Tax=Carassius auratus TaxID=7957 RepID=A0A6P6KCT3_CARAU|nr:complement decay-accelerating factor-like isoform X2 [Carassius auratus]